MDVSLSGTRVFLVKIVLLSLALISCGNRYDLSTERGRRARIDDANFHLSKGECAAAAEAIDPLFGSIYVDDEVRLVKASAFACFARFQLLTFVANFAGSSNLFQAFAKSLDNTTGDGARASLYSAVDVLTLNSTALNGGVRGKNVNSFMVFLQFGVISSILRNYGSPGASDGSQGASLVYDGTAATPAGEMSNADACSLAAAFSFISDSYSNSDLTDADSQTAVTAFNSVCVTAGFSSCAAINRDRSLCDGSNTNSVNAALIVTGVNAGW